MGLPEPVREALIAVATTAVGELAGGTPGAASAGNTVINNYLNHEDIVALGKARAACKDGNAACKEVDRLEAKDKATDLALDACSGNASSYCISVRQDVRSAAASIMKAGFTGLDIQEYLTSQNTVGQAQGTMSASAYAGGAVMGAITSIAEAIKVTVSAAGTILAAEVGNAQAATDIQNSLTALSQLTDPGVLAKVIDAASQAQRDQIAQAYADGDNYALGKILGNVLSLFAGPVDIAKGVSVAADAATIIKGAEIAKSGIIVLGDLAEVSPAASGGINATKMAANSYSLIDLSAAEKSLAQEIATGIDKSGAMTESLLDSVAQRQGMNSLDGGKYAGNKGFDHVYQNADGTVTILLDSKQVTNGTVSLSKGAGGAPQLSDDWISNVLVKLDQNSPAAKAVTSAMENGTLVKGVAGVDRNTGALTIVRVK